MPSNLTDALISSREQSAVVRTGVVSDWDPTYVQVTIGGSEVRAAFLDSYQPPIVGDLVAVIRQQDSWLVLGRYAGFGENLIVNPSFEDAAPAAGIPSGWFQFGTIAGSPPITSTVSTITDNDAPHAGQVVQMLPGASAQDVVLTSSAVPVNPGESYFMSAYVAYSATAGPVGSAVTPQHNVQILACWFSNDTESFPSPTLTGDYTMVDRIIAVRARPPYSYLRGSVTVPSSVPAGGVMRIGLRAEFGVTTAGVLFDYVTVRRGQ